MLSRGRSLRLCLSLPLSEGRSQVGCGPLGSGGSLGLCSPEAPCLHASGRLCRICVLKSGRAGASLKGLTWERAVCRCPRRCRVLAGGDLFSEAQQHPHAARGVLSTALCPAPGCPRPCCPAVPGLTEVRCIPRPPRLRSLAPRVTVSWHEGDFVPGLHAVALSGVPDTGCVLQSQSQGFLAWLPFCSLSCASRERQGQSVPPVMA